MATRVPGTTTSRDPEARDAHHALSVHEVVLLLQSQVDDGLSSSEARARLERFGPNVLPESATAGPLRRFVRQLHHPLVYVLLVAGVLMVLLGEHVDAAVIFGVVAVNAVVGFVQESRAQAALDALRSLVRTTARVRRDGQVRVVPSAELVPGDVVLVAAGDKVPADLRIVEETELEVDESALTGESLPVPKDEVVLPGATPVADRRNMVYSGTLVTRGSGVGLVVATGAETELGEIHRLVGAAETLATPLTRKLAWFARILTLAILALALLTFGAGLARGQGANEMLSAAVALAVGAIPEGLPAAVTITLAIGVARMAKRGAVIRRMPAVETLGSTTVICADKTGTLTENRMTVRTLWTPGETFSVTGPGDRPDGQILDGHGHPVTFDDAPPPLRWLLLAGAGCNEARLVHAGGHWQLLGDPTEAALLVAAAKAGLGGRELAATWPRVGTVPFSSERQWMATLHDDRLTGGRVVLVKGAPERVLGLCSAQMARDGSREPLDRDAVSSAADTLARDGQRVLAAAVARVDPTETLDPDGPITGLVLVGLHAMFDPPRPAAIAAVAACHTAGIAVKMITGDHATTAAAIARQLGILSEDHAVVLTGEDLARTPTSDLPAQVDTASVFARVSPEQKLRLVEALQARGHVVAMTGDGVNDAPALQQADIGVAMGQGGTEVAKDAADMVLTDDDFATIEAAIEEGRGVFDNLTKFIVWTLPTNMGEGMVILVAIVLGLTLPILPVQILWINMTTAVALGLMLAFEPKERGIMLRPPRDPRTPLLTRTLVVRMVLVSALLVGGAWWMFEWERATGASLAQARTAAVNLFVAVEAAYLFSCRSLTEPVWRTGLLGNPWLLVGVTAQTVAQLALTYVPAMHRIFGTAPIGREAWLQILGVAALASIVVAIDKHRQRRPDRAATPGLALNARS